MKKDFLIAEFWHNSPDEVISICSTELLGCR